MYILSWNVTWILIKSSSEITLTLITRFFIPSWTRKRIYAGPSSTITGATLAVIEPLIFAKSSATVSYHHLDSVFLSKVKEIIANYLRCHHNIHQLKLEDKRPKSLLNFQAFRFKTKKKKQSSTCVGYTCFVAP